MVEQNHQADISLYSTYVNVLSIPGRSLYIDQDDEDAQYLCRSLWADPSIAAELACRVLPWAGDVCRYEAGAVCRAVTAGGGSKLRF